MKILFLDESGDHSLMKIDPQYPMFVLGGVIMDKDYAKGEVTELVRDFKRRMLGSEDAVLHTADTTRNRNGFERMKEPPFRESFILGLNELMSGLDYKVVACAVQKTEHLAKYDVSALDPYFRIIEWKFRRGPDGSYIGHGLVILPKKRGQDPLRSSQPTEGC